LSVGGGGRYARIDHHDSRSSLALLASIVADGGAFAVSTSTNPLEALKLSETEQFDLVIVDHIMAEMDGVDVTRWLRSRDSYRLVRSSWSPPTPTRKVPPRRDRRRRHRLHQQSRSTAPRCWRGSATCWRCAKAQIDLADRAQWLGARKSTAPPGT